MQRNCHEFIAYENLVGSRGKAADRGGRPIGSSDVSKALPIVMRALKVLTEREVTPQLGLLKSTLLQLDSTFSERAVRREQFPRLHGEGRAGRRVTLKHAGRSMLVESREGSVVVEDLGAAAAEQWKPPPCRRPCLYPSRVTTRTRKPPHRR